MKLAFINQQTNYGGASRYDRMLLLALKKADPSIQITYFGNKAGLKRENIATELEAAGIRIVNVQAPLPLIPKENKKTRALKKYIRTIKHNWRNRFYNEVKKHDLAFFSWPYFIDVPAMDIPISLIVHDFNYMHFFGSFSFTRNSTLYVREKLRNIIERAENCIVSSKFIAQDYAQEFPEHTSKVNVIYQTPLLMDAGITAAEAHSTISHFNINSRYILYPCNLMPHKNVATLLSAFHLVRQQYPDVKLILTGPDTDKICGVSEYTGLLNDFSPEWNVRGLGYVSNKEIEALIKCAALIVTPSLYEAAPGPGTEAWAMGVPLAMSNLGFYTEYMEHFSAHAELFAPRDASDIAEKIGKILFAPEKYKELALTSKTNTAKFSRHDMATEYLEIFKAAINKKAG